MAVTYKNIAGLSTRENNVGGVTQRMWLAPKSAFTSISAVKDLSDLTVTDAKEFVEISDDHVFPTGKGFFEYYGTRDTGNAKLGSVGDRDGRSFNGTTEWFIPGFNSETLAQMVMAKNDNWIVLVELADGQIIQLGSARFPAEIKAEFDSQKNESGTRGTKLTITAFMPQPQVYLGAVQLPA